MTHPTETEIPSNAQPTQPAYLREGLLHRKQAVYRLDGADIRWYYTISSHGQVQFYGSVTSILDKTLPTSPYLINWIASHGVQGANRLRDQRAEYGTLMHLVIADYLQQEYYNLNMMQFIVNHYVREHRIQYDTSWWAESLQKDLLSFDTFCKEYQVKPLAVEMVCAAPSLGYAGCIDLVCEMTVMEKGFADGVVYASGKNAGQPKEVKIPKTIRAIVDFKSGKHQFYENNEIQANMYMNLWNTCYPEAKVDRCYNWRPSEWEGVDPTYTVKDQTRVSSSQKIPHLMKLFLIDVPPAPKPSLVMDGTINLNGQFNGVIRRKPAEETALERRATITQGGVSLEGAAAIGEAIAKAAVNLAIAARGVVPFPSGGVVTPEAQTPAEIIKSQGVHIHAGSAPVIKDTPKKAKPETIEIVTPSVEPPSNREINEAFAKQDLTREGATSATPKQVKTFLPDDDDIADEADDEVITPAPEPKPKAPSPTLDALKAELAGSKPNGKLQTA
jgi:hypothetical protein